MGLSYVCRGRPVCLPDVQEGRFANRPYKNGNFIIQEAGPCACPIVKGEHIGSPLLID